MSALVTILALPRFGDVNPELVDPASDALIAGHPWVIDGLGATKPEKLEAVWPPLERSSLSTAFGNAVLDATVARLRQSPVFPIPFAGGL